MQQYLELMRDIIDNGTDKGDRTGTGTVSVFARQQVQVLLHLKNAPCFVRDRFDPANRTTTLALICLTG